MSLTDNPVDLDARVATILSSTSIAAGGIVVAVSGGADSVALARAICTMDVKVVIAHFNHQLRSAESDMDANFVQNLAAQLGNCGRVRFRTTTVNVRECARRSKENLEAAARRVRYAWLSDIAEQEGIRWVATGHSADDQAETVLHHLLRGTGIKGLRGIAERRRLVGDIELIRPFLRTWRTEVLTYLGMLGQKFRDDSSNTDLRFTRNRIRHELLPSLAMGFNPAIASALCRLAEEARSVYQRRMEAADGLLAQAECPRAGDAVVLRKLCLARASRPLVRDVLRTLWEREGWNAGRMNRDAWKRVAGLAFGDADSVDLPNGIRATANGRVIQIRKTL